MNIVILGDGDFPVATHPLQILEKADKIICCDASVLKLIRYGITPDYIVGDMDTLEAAGREKYKDLIRYSGCRETNDQTKAFSFALGLLPAGEKANIHILGATGGREDHTLGNISLLMDYARTGSVIGPFGNKVGENITVDIVTDHGIFTPRFNSFTAAGVAGQQISVFSFDPTLRIQSSGLVYPTGQVVFDLWWKASLNECTGEEYTLTFSHPADVLIFENYTG